MKTKVVLTALLLLTGAGAGAQNSAFFPTKPGTVLVMGTKNGKGKPVSHTRTTVDAVRGQADSLFVDYTLELLDDKMQRQGEDNGTIKCTVSIIGGLVVMDMKDFSAPMAQSMPGAKVEVSGIPPQISGNLQPGERIPDANVTVAITAGVMKMKSTLAITNSQCVAVEEVTTPAGTFSCHKITQDSAATTMGMTVRGKSVAWYARGIGMVKCEAYDDKGRLLSSNELISMQ